MADRRQTLGAMAVAMLSLSLPACLSPVPLDPKPQADLDPRIVGRWRCVGPQVDDDDVPLNLHIERGRDRVYPVRMFETGKEPDRLEAHASLVGGRTIVNVRDLSEKAGRGSEPWDFVEYEFLRPDVLHIRVADFEWPEGVAVTPAALRARIAEPGAFKDFCVCVRKGKSE